MLLVFTVAVVCVATPDVFAQRAWQAERDCEFSMGEPGTWDGGALEGTAVLFADGLFHMFYSGSDNGGQRSGHQLGYAWSQDGCNWVRHPLNPILGNLLSWESAGVLNPTVVRDRDGYKLWYSGWSTTSCGIGFATSEDPFLFERFSAEPSIGPGVVSGLTCVFDPVVHWDGALYRMWYTGSVSDRFAPRELRFATSADGLVWDDYPQNPVFGEAARAPSIVRHEDTGTYEMWYGTAGISYATSMDGLSWTRVGGVELAGESDDFGNPTVLLVGDTYHMWYTATTSFIAWPYIRHATSEWVLPRASFEARSDGAEPGSVPVSGAAPLRVDFDATGSRSPAKGGITDYFWDFGNREKGAGVRAQQVYPHGTYDVILRVADAAGNQGEGGRSIVAMQPSTLLPGWIPADIGTVSLGGAVREADGCWEAAEADGFVGLNEDQFHYVYQLVTGDFVLEAEVTVPEAAARNSRLGLMARETLGTGARMVYHQIRSGRIRASRREGTGEQGKTSVLYRLGDEEKTIRLRLERRSDVFTGFYSLDGGLTWVEDIPQSTDYPETITVGVALAGTPANLLSSWRVCDVELRQDTTFTAFRRGDVNGNRERELSDGIFVLEYLFLERAEPSCLKAADLDDSGNLDLADPVFLLNHLFLGGRFPPPPGEACGRDPTQDDLSCAGFGGCS